ncbi:regulating synaptic membrane exocytosis protein fife isoform X2 [Rhodnius prolixus]|uniref:regulating synaptic membrane exocytosis protein fife isoform X2 n=1 Tax=Rhodnius prolixus TaxID=13249 RepID=UPI003D18E1C2
MIPSNVVSFMKKMVTTEGVGTAGGGETGGGDTTLSKIRHTLSSSLMTAQDRVTNKLSQGTKQPEPPPPAEQPKPPEEPPKVKSETGKPVSRFGTCRVCLKAFKGEDEFNKTCGECHQKVCEDCASYSKPDDTQDEASWKCSICRRRAASRVQAIVGQDSTDSLLDAPVLEALQRRHSDVKLGSSLTAGQAGGLAPPRSPELRRHSDVSPASLKELEKAVLKVTSDREWRQRGGRGGASTGGSPNASRTTSPSVEWRPLPGGRQLEEPPVAIQAPPPEESSDEAWRRAQAAAAAKVSRRKSRVQKQRSYDDESKTTQGQVQPADTGLVLPASLPRRASAYDVFAPRGETMSTTLQMANVNPPTATTGIREPSTGGTRRSSFRAVPQDPDEPAATSLPVEPPTSLGVEEDRRTRRRGSQLPDISALRGGLSTQIAATRQHPVSAPPTVNRETSDSSMRRQTSVADGEAIKIVIHDVDCETSYGPRTTSKRRVTLRRDPSDKAHRTRGFGMRVVGGKTGIDGRLFAYIVWTVPSGPAEKGGLQQGDKVLEWGGVSLVDKTFEEVCSIMDRTGDTVDLLVEHGTDLRMCDLLDEPVPAQVRKNSGEALSLGLDADIDKSPVSPTRRKLPKTPEQLAKEKAERLIERNQVSGRVQLQVWYNDDKNELVVSVFAADDLAYRDDLVYGSQPEAYLQLRLLPFSSETAAIKTEVAEPTQNPIWNTTLELKNVRGEHLMEKTIEVTLWDYKPDKEQVFLGECCVDLQKALLDDNPVWYRLEDPRQLRSGGNRSPRSSLASDTSIRTLRRGDRSQSETSDLELEGCMFLHPDHAYMGGSRRGSSQSEQLEFEPYQLPRDFHPSKSLPGSRRSSFQSSEKGDAEPPPPSYVKERRRSSICRAMRDPDEILRSLKAVKGELLGRAASIRDKRRASRSGSLAGGDMRRKDSAVQLELTFNQSSPSDEEDKWSTKSEVKQLGPGQIQPRGYQQKLGGQVDIKLSLLMTKGQLEVEVICARGIKGEPPDTYVKTYLREGERWLQKRKTRVVRRSNEPQFRQTLRYAACDITGRTLVVMLWERQGGFEHNAGLGGAELALENLVLTQITVGWYPLFPMHTLASDSNDSP